MMLLYHSNFFAQGMVNQIWRSKLHAHSSEVAKSAMFPFLMIGSIAFYVMSMPGSYTNVGRRFFYPNYGDMIMQSIFTTGTWNSIYGLEWIMRKQANYVKNKKVFKFFTTGSLFVYLCHDMWITILSTLIVNPFYRDGSKPAEWGLPVELCLVIVFFGTEILSNLNYYLLVRLFLCCRNRKKKNKGRKAADKVIKIQ
jgi:hypothetical protein